MSNNWLGGASKRMTEPKQTATEPNSQPAGEEHKYVVSEEVVVEFVGNLKLREVQVVAARLVLMSEICQGLLAGELESDYIHCLRGMARRLSTDESRQLSEAILAAIDEGEHLLSPLLETINRAWQMTGNCTWAGSSEAELGEIARLRVSVLEDRRKRRSEKKRGTKRLGKGVAPRLTVRHGVVLLPLLRGVGRFIKSDRKISTVIASRWRPTSTLDGQPASAARLTPRLACPAIGTPEHTGNTRSTAPRASAGRPDTNCLPSSSGTRGLLVSLRAALQDATTRDA